MVIHKVEFRNYGNDRVRFVGEKTECGKPWKQGSRVWKYVTCKRCLRSRKKP